MHVSGDACQQLPQLSSSVEALAQLVLGKKKKVDKVCLSEELDKCGLGGMFPECLWPQSAAVSLLVGRALICIAPRTSCSRA